MILPCLIICSHICRFISYFLVAGPDVQVLCELPSLLLFMASLAAVVAQTIELSWISSPIISLGENSLFLEEAVNCSMALISAMVTFAFKLVFYLSVVMHNKSMFLDILIFLVWLFIKVHQVVQGDHIFLQVVHIHTAYFSTLHLIYSYLVHFVSDIMAFDHSLLLVIESPCIFLTWFSIYAKQFAVF